MIRLTSHAISGPIVSASSVSSLFSLEQRYQFKQAGVGYYIAGELAYVMTADGPNQFGNSFYLIRSDGGIYAYEQQRILFPPVDYPFTPPLVVVLTWNSQME